MSFCIPFLELLIRNTNEFYTIKMINYAATLFSFTC
mgnify:CR=1 FL=1